MGMAASQARFLGLTARKTNTEFEGQQVNQQRTSLANESSGLFNQMLTLKVPIPPDTNNFYNMRYTYADGSDNYEITNYAPSTTVDNAFVVNVIKSNYVDKGYKQTLNTVAIKQSTTTPGSWSINVGSSTNAITPAQNLPLATEMGIKDSSGNINPNFYKYTDSASNKDYYMSEADFLNYTKSGDYSGSIDQYYYQSTKQTTNEKIDGVTFVDNGNGSFAKITVPGQGTMALSTERVRDDVGYQAAMSDYSYTKDLYDKTIADINAQTSVIQQQDRTLELRLKQLDTEQQALQTEMDAVSKVIDKNIESTFKTFA